MIRICDHPDCATLTLGTFCITHEPPVEAEIFPRGRPFPRRRERPVVPSADPAQLTPGRAVSLGGGIAR
jgi:hypothetical protein